jgi:uncharacterized protein YjiS (DUF1127 family)
MGRALNVFTVWQRHVAECNVLARLDDRALRDIGLTRRGVQRLTRTDLERELMQSFWCA